METITGWAYKPTPKPQASGIEQEPMPFMDALALVGGCIAIIAMLAACGLAS